MQLTSIKGSMVIDYYPTKSIFDNKIIDEVFLKIVSFKGKTMKKSIIKGEAYTDELVSYKDHDYAITINTKRPAQFINPKEAI
jgi:hypothetical protein